MEIEDVFTHLMTQITHTKKQTDLIYHSGKYDGYFKLVFDRCLDFNVTLCFYQYRDKQSVFIDRCDRLLLMSTAVIDKSS